MIICALRLIANDYLFSIYFQYHYGTIMSRQSKLELDVIFKFQYHYGTIMRKFGFNLLVGVACFNTTMVQL